MTRRLPALGGVLLLLGGLALACASDSPEQHAKGSAAAGAAADGFPPTGPIHLRRTPPPPEGTLYQVVSGYDGRTEFSAEGAGSLADAKAIDEVYAIEIDFRQLPMAAPEGQLASSLVLEALQRRARTSSSGQEHLVEIGDDRLRVSTNDKVTTDLRGAQPKQDLTPRSLLGKSFAIVVTDGLGNPQSITVRGTPSGKKLLSSFILREPMGYVLIPVPDRPVSPGDTWHARRFFPNPVGRLGLAVDVELRLVGYEKIGAVPCARVSLRAAKDEKGVPTETGLTLDEVRYSLAGDAWLDLRTGNIEQVRIEDVSAVSYVRKSGGGPPARVRMRYNTRSGAQRLDELPKERWADGSKRFSAVK